MCGIIGLLSSSYEDQDELQHILARAIDKVSHRGPDDFGIEFFANKNISLSQTQILALGHTRLSIIDLSAAGHQPMHSSNGRYVIIFNGEIYNYSELREELKSSGSIFCSNSDTEVLLAAWERWGHECMRRLNGMFSFAIYDKEDRTLALVRDAFGIKPIYYSKSQIYGRWAFASELPPLLEMLPVHPALNLQRAYDYLAFGSYDEQQETLFENIVQLPPGHWLKVSLDDGSFAEPIRWWWPNIEENTSLTFIDAVEKLREIFLKNIRLHLRSDVPIGAALSGGVDSSAVVCAMRYLEPDMPIHTFTYVSSDDVVNEEKWADIINSYIGAISHKVKPSSLDLAKDLDTLILTQGEPFGSTSIYAQYRVFQAARDTGITVTLDGQGADELLAGYSGYPHARIRSLLDKHDYLKAVKFLYSWSKWPGRRKRQATFIAIRALLPRSLVKPLRKILSTRSSPWLDQNWLLEHGISGRSARSTPNVNISWVHGRHLSATLRDAINGYGLTALLRHGDRNSMHWSIESRVPFLTIELAEFLLSLPEEYLLSSNGETKAIFREAMRGIVPDAILDRKDKVGFETPEQTWLREIPELIEQWLLSAKEIPFLNHKEVVSFVQSSINGSIPFGWQAWRLINFCRWFQIMQPRI